MSDLLDKLNTLLRANLGNLFGSSGSTDHPPRLPEKITPEMLGKDIDREISALRRQIDSAISEEDRMKNRLNAAQTELADLDKKADQTLERGDEAGARQIVQNMQRLRAKIRQMEQELDRHQGATFDLIQHVNTLESMVSDARRELAEKEGAPPPPPPVDQQEAARTAGSVLSDVLRSVREKVEEIITPRPAESGTGTPSSSTPAPETSNQPAPASSKVEVKTERPATPSAGTKIPVKVGTATNATAPTPETKADKAQPAPTPSASPAPKTAADSEVDADLARRRSRLSKPE
ncbi:MAG: PspA/IM30 family protein [Anaerolinea sp.]|nr:PspA/IM30 family protein [Anaerolinea sp.]MCC6973614.1 PspA/IM30 family protein [Anaerolineae bacterium]CAG0962169.1 hypothetical protein ANRL4_00739 [Anaerolineae bacterium]